MRRTFLFGAAVIVVALTFFAIARSAPTGATDATKTYPTSGWTLHIDAKKHFPGDRSMVAHHFCRAASGGITECQIYDSDKPDARLVATEVIVPAAMWKTFPASEKKLWHYHRREIPRVDAVLPDMSKAEAAKVASSLMETYGKVYVLWDPSKQQLPTGMPSVSIVN